MFTVPLDFVEGTVKKPVDKEKAKPKDIPEENEKERQLTKCLQTINIIFNSFH